VNGGSGIGDCGLGIGDSCSGLSLCGFAPFINSYKLIVSRAFFDARAEGPSIRGVPRSN